jgi:hypothetical protein
MPNFIPTKLVIRHAGFYDTGRDDKTPQPRARQIEKIEAKTNFPPGREGAEKEKGIASRHLRGKFLMRDTR